MRTTILPIAALALGCANVPSDRGPVSDIFRSYDAGPGGHLQSTFFQHEEAGVQTLKGVTQLADGRFIAEDAVLDANGRLLRAEARIGGACDQMPTRIVLDAQSGSVDVATPQLTTHWSVPSDLPWIWSPLLGADRAQLATPVSLVVALRGAASAGEPHAVRMLDLQHYQSDTLMVDQLVVSDTDSTHVVLGDDVADIADGLPQHIRWAAPERDLEAQTLERSAAWAFLRCAEPQNSTTL